MECALFSVLLFLASSGVLAGTTLQGNDLVVKRGFQAVLKLEHLRVVPNDSIVCRIEIMPDPVCLRFGNMTSDGFYCYPIDSKPVSYSHSGSGISDADCIKMKLLLFYEDKTVIKMVKVNVAVQNRSIEEKLSTEVVAVNKIGGKASFGHEILPVFTTKYLSTCRVKLSSSSADWPANGKVLNCGNGGKMCKCSAFKAEYIHDGSYIPNVDYIPFAIAWKNESGHSMELKYQLKVKIKGAQQNEPPVLYSRRPRIIVKQYSTTQIRNTNLRAIDYRTDPSKLLLKISPLKVHDLNGYFSSVDDPRTNLEGITQEMIDKGRLLFVAPKKFRARRSRSLFVQQFLVQAVDQHGAVSTKRLRMIFFVRKFIPQYLSVVENNPIRVLEGSFCRLGTESMDILCPGSKCARAKFSVVGEPKHGSLLINEKKINQFMYHDLKTAKILYRHDNSESIVDNIIISLMEQSQLAITTLNVIIEPIDDSPPFLSVHKDILASHGQLTKIDVKILQASDPDSRINDIVFRIVTKPKGGSVKKHGNRGFISVKEFSEVDLEKGLIYYNAYAKEPTNDSFVVVLFDKKPNFSKRYTMQVKVLAADTIPPRKRRRGECLAWMHETDASIPLDFIDYVDNVSPSSEIFIKLMPHKQNDYKYVRYDDIVRKTGHSYTPSASFTQQELFHRKILYINNNGEIGVHIKNLRFDFVVSDMANNTTPIKSCTVEVHPIDNKAPVISILGEINVAEGGRLCINRSHIEVRDVDTALAGVKLRLGSMPKHGRVVYMGKNLSEIGESIDYLNLRGRCLWYFHDDSETKEDAFILSASDGVNDGQSSVAIKVKPVNDLRPYFVKKSKKILVMENSSVVIGPNLLTVTDNDSPKSAFQFHITKQPKLGYLEMKIMKVTKFMQSDVDNDLLIYRHKNNEIGPHSAYDDFTVVVCDLPQLAEDCVSFINVKVEIIPINSNPPKLMPGVELTVKEGNSCVIGVNNLSCKDKDTLSGRIVVQILKFPSFGFLENVAPSAGSEQSNSGLHISDFQCSDLEKRSINYVQNNHTGFEPRSDSFKVIAFDGEFNSTIVTIRVRIRPSSDERPTLKQIAPVKVQEGGWVLINKKQINIEDKDVPEDVLKIYVTRKAKHGQMFYKCDGNASPRLQRLTVNAPIDYLLCALIYVHDDSETLFDSLHVEVTDGKLTSMSVIGIEVIPVNDERPQVVKNIAMTVRFGGFKNITRSYLVVQDLDTHVSQLRYRVTKLPSYGSLKLYSNGVPYRMLLNSTFTQDDINKERLSYVNHIMPVSGLTESINFSLSDGVHFIGNQTFTIRIRLSCRKYFRVKTKDVQSNGAKIYITASHLRAQRRKATNQRRMVKTIVFHIIRQPKYGVLSLDTVGKRSKVTVVTEIDLKEKRLVYRPFEYPRKKNDSFRFFATDGKCMQRGKLQIFTMDMNLTVQLMKRVSPLNVKERGVTSITSLEIRAQDRFNSEKVIYRTKTLPQHGVILKDGVNVSSFFQRDINELRVSYLLLDVRAKDDDVQFEVLVKDYYGIGIDSQAEIFPLKINIDIPNTGTVRVITNEPITALEKFDKNSIGAPISKHHLLSYDCTSSFDSNLTYTVIEPPVHGELIFKDSGDQATIFTQGDINLGRVLYKLTDQAHTEYRDSLILDLESKGCEKLLGERFTVKWSKVSISEKIKVECAGLRTNIAINLTREGYIDQGSVVEIHTKSLTDNVETIAPSRLWFHPGHKYKTWRMPEEALEYEKVEIYLNKEFNTLLGRSRLSFDVARSEDACSLEREKNQKTFANVKADSSSVANPGKIDQGLKNTNRKFAACATGWVGFQKNCFFINKKASSWRKAKKFCKKKNASLYTPLFALEDIVVTKIRKNKAIWIGLLVDLDKKEVCNTRGGVTAPQSLTKIIRPTEVYVQTGIALIFPHPPSFNIEQVTWIYFRHSRLIEKGRANQLALCDAIVKGLVVLP